MYRLLTPRLRVTSLEQLSLAEFSGELVRPKVYENDHKNVLGIWIDLEGKVKYSTILSEINRIFLNFFYIEEYENRRTTFIINIFW